MIVLGLTGFAGSGKSTVAAYLKKYGFELLSFSDVLREEANKRGLLKDVPLEQQKMILSQFGNAWRAQTGKREIIAERLVEKIKTADFKKVIVDGFRSPEEVELFRARFDNFKLIYVTAEQFTRFERRQHEDSAASKEMFFRRDAMDMKEKGLGDVVQMADMTIKNNSTFVVLFKQLDDLLAKLQ